MKGGRGAGEIKDEVYDDEVYDDEVCMTTHWAQMRRLFVQEVSGRGFLGSRVSLLMSSLPAAAWQHWRRTCRGIGPWVRGCA